MEKIYEFFSSQYECSTHGICDFVLCRKYNMKGFIKSIKVYLYVLHFFQKR